MLARAVCSLAVILLRPSWQEPHWAESVQMVGFPRDVSSGEANVMLSILVVVVFECHNNNN